MTLYLVTLPEDAKPVECDVLPVYNGILQRPVYYEIHIPRPRFVPCDPPTEEELED